MPGEGPTTTESADPVKRFGFTNEDIQKDEDLSRVRKVLEKSRAFTELMKILRSKGVTVTSVVRDLPSKAGGGSTRGRGDQMGIVIDPLHIPSGIHVIDVYAHEWGEVWEKHGGPPPDDFMNRVQDELGIRRTRGHPPESKPESTETRTPSSLSRDRFARPGTRDKPSDPKLLDGGVPDDSQRGLGERARGTRDR